MAAPKITRADVGKSAIQLSPSKARAATFVDAVPTRVEAGHKNSGPKILRISDLPDPDSRYAGLLKAYSPLADAKVTTPDVRDTQGVLITPAEYHSKISNGDIIEVEVILKLWSIQPNPRGNPNGSRIYQTILPSMKILPFHSYSQRNILQVKAHTFPQPLPAVDKGKHKADGDEMLAGQSPTKKCVPMPRVSATVEKMDVSGEDE